MGEEATAEFGVACTGVDRRHQFAENGVSYANERFHLRQAVHLGSEHGPAGLDAQADRQMVQRP
jgi:hypothetical protein